MSISKFVSQLWVARMQAIASPNRVYTAIAQCPVVAPKGLVLGSKVNIITAGNVTLKPYVKGTPIDSAEDAVGTSAEMEIDHAVYLNYSVDDVDQAQSNIKIMDAYAKAHVDAFVEDGELLMAAKFANCGTTLTIGTDLANIEIDKTNAYDYLVDLSSMLTDAKIPKADRFVVIPSWYAGFIKKNAAFSQVTDASRTGIIGSVDGMLVFESPFVPNTAKEDYKVIAGHLLAAAYNDDIKNTEAYRPQSSFSDAIKALAVSGGKVVEAKAIAILTCKPKTV